MTQDDSNSPLFSIILPNLNSDKYLRKCMESFLTQDYQKKRLIVVDAKSTDTSHKIIYEFAEAHAEIEWLHEVDKGLSDAINIGLNQVQDGEIFGFLGADDLLLPETLTTIAKEMSARTEAIGIFCDSYSQNSKGERKLRQCPCETMALPMLLKHRTIAGLQNTYFRSEIVKQYLFNQSAKYAMDYELYLRLAKDGLGEHIVHIARPSTININDENISTRFSKASKREAFRFAYQIAPFGWRKIVAGLRSLR